MRFRSFANQILNAAAILAIATTQTFACPMCKASIANADNADEISTPINMAILALLAPTLALIGALVKLVFKYRNYHHLDQFGERAQNASTPDD